MGLLNWWSGSSAEDQASNASTIKTDLAIDKSKEPVFISLAKIEKSLDSYLIDKKNLLQSSNDGLLRINKSFGKTVVSDEINPNVAKLLTFINQVMRNDNGDLIIFNSIKKLDYISANKSAFVAKYGEEFTNDFNAVTSKLNSIKSYNSKIQNTINEHFQDPSNLLSKEELENLIEKFDPVAKILVENKIGKAFQEIEDFTINNFPAHINETSEPSADYLI